MDPGQPALLNQAVELDQEGRCGARSVQQVLVGERDVAAQLPDEVATGWDSQIQGPGELAELSRYAREVGWPGYEWRYDPMRKRVTGTTATP